MSDTVWIIFFTVLFPVLLVPGILGFHALFLLIIILFPAILNTIEDYLFLWFVFESLVIVNLLVKNLMPQDKK